MPGLALFGRRVPDPPSDPIAFNVAWIGAVTDDAATLAFEAAETATVRLVVSTDSDLSVSPIYGSTATGVTVGKSTVTGLASSTLYNWGVEVDGHVQLSPRGTFTSFITEGAPGSFTFALGSCSNALNPASFQAIANAAPLFLMHMGDLHYRDINSNNPALFEDAYRDIHAETRPRALFDSVPIAYVWDDHDFAGNNSHSSSTARPAALSTYRAMVPHYPLFDPGSSTSAVGQTFVCGRVRFLVLDQRSARVTSSTLLGAAQKQWLIDQIDAATEAMLVIVTCVPWISDGSGADGDDNWSSAASERQAIANALESNGLSEKTLMIAGDAHMLAVDDGTNSHYASTGSAPGPVVFHAAPFDNGAGTKGGPYSEGTITSSTRQYGTVQVADSGTTITVTCRGFQVDGTTCASTEVLEYEFEV